MDRSLPGLPFALMFMLAVGGCAAHHSAAPDGRHHSDVIDASFKRRPYDHRANAKCDPAMALARELTEIEDDLRRDGTITVKQPDVWGDGNMMYFLQEYDKLLAKRTELFAETVQAYVARSDNMEVQSTTALSAALGGDPAAAAPTLPEATIIDLDDPGLFEILGKARTNAPSSVEKIGVEPTELARQHSTYIDVCQALRRRHMGDDNSRAAGYGLYKFRVPISVLPGRETNHGHAAVATLRAQLIVDEANLRYTFPRLAIADLVESVAPLLRDRWDKSQDPQIAAAAKNIRTAAENSRNWAKPVREHIQEMFIAENEANFLDQKRRLLNLLLEDETTPTPLGTVVFGLACDPAGQCLSQATFEDRATSKLERYRRVEQALPAYFADRLSLLADDLTAGRITIDQANVELERLQDLAAVPSDRKFRLKGATPVAPPPHIIRQIYTEESLDTLIAAIKQDMRITFREPKPELQELRSALFSYFGQVNVVLEERQVFSTRADEIACIAQEIVTGNYAALAHLQENWISDPGKAGLSVEIANSSWFVAIHAGLLNHNLKRILRSLKLEDKVPDDLVGLIDDPGLQFYNPDSPLREQTFALWTTIIREEFPIHVFTLDAQVEEQNVYDAFARRRELQLALAYSVANGRFNMQQKLAASRQLALEEATIALNRTVVGFAHGNDTFGWYFYPRVQTPPTESTNIGAFARMIWSTGPTECYDMKHRNLEPGIRECEVLVAMPSFITQVGFDVTTNWESLAHPGVTKRSYEEMLAQGGRIYQLKSSLGDACDEGFYRPGDVQRLVSRVDQLEQMLGMQSYAVKVPFDFEQSGTGIFDQGRNKLVPVLTSFYGLDFLKDDEKITEANFFLTGRNFHPTLTHVITGGFESHSVAAADAGLKTEVEIINRQLARVKVQRLYGGLTDLKRGFQVRVGTPDGLSNALRIEAGPATPAAKGFSFDGVGDVSATFKACEGNPFDIHDLPAEVRIANDQDFPIPANTDGRLILVLTAKNAAGADMTLGGAPQVETEGVVITLDLSLGRVWRVEGRQLEAAIETAINTHQPADPTAAFEITATGYVHFDQFPITKMLNAIKITVRPCPCGVGCGGALKPLPATEEELPAPNQQGPAPGAREANPTAPSRTSDTRNVPRLKLGPLRHSAGAPS